MYKIDFNWRDTFPQIEGDSVTAYELYDENGHAGFVAFEWVNYKDVVAHLQFDRFELSIAKQIKRHWEEFKEDLIERGMERLCACVTEDMADISVWKKFLKLLKLNEPQKYFISITEV